MKEEKRRKKKTDVTGVYTKLKKYSVFLAERKVVRPKCNKAL